MLLQNLFPFLPFQLLETLIYIVAALGIVLITYGVFLETERRQDLVFLVGALCLFDYALYIGNRIFMIAMAGFALASLVEFIEIMIGLHKEEGKHTLKKIKQVGKK
ncbi:hypothetical protein C0581_02320 [Candidatus Parcubacteria bacterium]|nr:MAG: hypothetical protein C0581_02320 [Candidatus Parcubacteria bacterium]